ncbi:isoleucine N-monooxygenase 2-like [Dorcoceras hygrometricum]|uniref:Isoleucine N-monooxygenase 2-like n=1 Tax=Dorcoceras hygrometricum TaxID=472368 RepID=A0A2Z7AQA0_9LAMI|nr:isoleucine N-monooxygenase 2-like [Dorcoceras hygrometricum]
MSASGESSTTMHRLLHASGSHPIPPPNDPKSSVNRFGMDQLGASVLEYSRYAVEYPARVEKCCRLREIRFEMCALLILHGSAWFVRWCRPAPGCLDRKAARRRFGNQLALVSVCVRSGDSDLDCGVTPFSDSRFGVRGMTCTSGIVSDLYARDIDCSNCSSKVKLILVDRMRVIERLGNSKFSHMRYGPSVLAGTGIRVIERMGSSQFFSHELRPSLICW